MVAVEQNSMLQDWNTEAERVFEADDEKHDAHMTFNLMSVNNGAIFNNGHNYFTTKVASKLAFLTQAQMEKAILMTLIKDLGGEISIDEDELAYIA